MGLVLSAARAEARKQQNDTEKITNDALNSLVDLAKLQTALFKAQTKDSSDSTRIKISKFLREDTVIKCSVDYDATKISQHVQKVYKAFANSDVAAAIGDALNTALEALFGSSTANSNESSMYFVTVGNLGYPYRVDMHLYTYSFTSDTLTSVTKNVLAISLMVSSVDLTDLTESDLGTIVQVCYEQSDEAVMTKILDKLKSVRDSQIKEKKDAASGGSSSTAGGDSSSSSNAAKASVRPGQKVDRDDRLSLGGGKFPLDTSFEAKSHGAWRDAMRAEEAIPSYQVPEVPEGMRKMFLDRAE